MKEWDLAISLNLEIYLKMEFRTYSIRRSQAPFARLSFPHYEPTLYCDIQTINKTFFINVKQTAI